MQTPHARLVVDRRPTYSIIASPPATLVISFVVPVRDDAESIPALAAEITTAMSAAPWSWECVWVDDGSRDGTALVLERVAREDPRHRALSLPKTVGQSAALAAGLSAARGELIVTLDGGGHDDPAQVPAMILMLIRTRADMVTGWRETRSDGLLRRISSRVGNGIRGWLTGHDVRDVGCSLRVFRRDVVQGLFVFRGLHRFLPTLARLNGAVRIIYAPIRHRRRLGGKTGPGVHDRLWVGLADAFAIRWLLARAVSAGIARLSPARALDQDRA